MWSRSTKQRRAAMRRNYTHEMNERATGPSRIVPGSLRFRSAQTGEYRVTWIEEVLDEPWLSALTAPPKEPK